MISVVINVVEDAASSICLLKKAECFLANMGFEIGARAFTKIVMSTVLNHYLIHCKFIRWVMNGCVLTYWQKVLIPTLANIWVLTDVLFRGIQGQHIVLITAVMIGLINRQTRAVL